jgi:uncharacterized protein (TIGR03083 family)
MTTTTADQIRGLRADRDALLRIAEGLRPEQWGAPSGCAGWNTKDLVSHLGSLFWAVVDGSVNPDTSGLAVEEAVSVQVEARRALNPAEVLADYENVSSRALEALTVVATLDMDVPFSDFESYPASVVPLAFCFDHYTHIRFDLVIPRGSVDAVPPPSDALRLAPTLDWIEVALPRQNPGALAALPGRIDLVVSGPGGRTISLGGGKLVATVESDGPGFVCWVTRRGEWDDLGVKAEGSPEALEVTRSIKVY